MGGKKKIEEDFQTGGEVRAPPVASLSGLGWMVSPLMGFWKQGAGIGNLLNPSGR